MYYHNLILETLQDNEHPLPPISEKMLQRCDWRILGDGFSANVNSIRVAPESFDWQRIGTMGWDWQNQKSMFWFFDIDDIGDHPTCGVSPEVMADAIERLQNAKFASVFRSRRGNGIQGIILAPPNTNSESQAQHAAIGQAVKAKLIEVTGIDPDHFDKFGQVGWVAATEHADDAYEVIQHATETVEFDSSAIPAPQVRQPRHDATETISDNLAEILQHYHAVLIDAGDGQYFIHGAAFDEALEKAGRDRVGFPSGNTNRSEQNHVITDCSDYLYCGNFEPAESDQRFEKCHWIIKQGEAPATPRSFEEANKIAGGRPGKRNSFVYETTKASQWAARLCGGEIPDTHDNRQVTLTLRKKDNQVCATTRRDQRDEDWIVEERTNLHTFDLCGTDTAKDHDFLRCVIDEITKQRSWVSKLDLPDEALPHDAWPDCNGDTWAPIDSKELTGEMARHGIPADERTAFRGELHSRPMIVGCRHFQPEYQRNFWNRYGAQYPVVPVQGDRPVTDAFLDHLGKSIQAAVNDDPWCRRHCNTGGAFLRYWLMRLIRYPLLPLPMLHLCSLQQGTGKSTFLKLVRRLLPGHTIDTALALREKHNAQLLYKLVGTIDEDDIRGFANAKQQIRRMITGEKQSIRDMQKTMVEYDNTIKLLAATNDPSFIPIDHGDRRVIVTDEITAPAVDNPNLIKDLERELPFFLYTLINDPEPQWFESELGMPTLMTNRKRELLGEAPVPLADQVDVAIAAAGLDAWRPKDIRPFVGWDGTDKSIETRLGNEMKNRFDKLPDGRYTHKP